jgi:ABC-type branched-subunit amino acid transport system ATPase component
MSAPATATTEGLVVSGLQVQFGGLMAVADVSIEVPCGRLTGLIGPNGAGKTTTFNACSGLNQPTKGTISLFGDDVSGTSPSKRARLGLGRTFQRMELFDRQSVRDNVAMGREAGFVGKRFLGPLFSTRAEAAIVKEAADAALELCGLTEIRDRRVGALSTGQRRLVELARALAGDFRLLLLDEPSSGLDVSETHRFGEILTTVVRDRGVGILLVEHDMELVTTVCDYVYVLDFGALIDEGTIDHIISSEIVRSAYLGSTD